MLDVIVTSTCRKTIKRTIESFLEHFQFSNGFNFIVHVDVMQPENIKWMKNLFSNYEITDIYFNNNLKGHSNAINYLIQKIEAPYYFHLEDDWVFLQKINLDQLIDLMKTYHEIDHIRFNKEKIQPKAWLYHLSPDPKNKLLLPKQQCNINGIDLVKTHVWSFNPSIARTSRIKQVNKIPLNHNPEQFICHQYPKIARHPGTYIYGRIGSGHVCKDIGRPHPIIRRMKSFLNNPSYHIRKYFRS